MADANTHGQVIEITSLLSNRACPPGHAVVAHSRLQHQLPMGVATMFYLGTSCRRGAGIGPGVSCPRRFAVVLFLAVVVTLSGCKRSGGQQEVRTAVKTFFQQAASGNAKACDLASARYGSQPGG